MVKRSSSVLLIASLIALVVCLQPVFGQTSSGPQLPHEFWGEVLIGDSPAGIGLEVEAVGPGVISGINGNPVLTMAGGVYGEPGLSSQILIVQGDIEPGTPIEFFVGGTRAEVYPVSTNGPWKTNYSYIPGDVTELNLRIAAQPSSGQTREPTPVQTRLPASAVQGFLPAPSVISTVQPGIESTGNQPAVQPTVPVQPAGTATSESQGTVTIPEEHPTAVTGEQSLPGGISTTMLFAGIVVIVVIILGGSYYAMSRKKSGKEVKEEGKEEEKAGEKKED
jgi:hypothetical protein